MSKHNAPSKRRPSDAQPPREVVIQIASALHGLGERHLQAAKSLVRLAIGLSAADQPLKMVQAMFKYIQSALPDSEMVADALTVLEGTQPPEWQAKQAKQRHNALREKARTRLGYGHDQGPVPEWEWNAILSAAKQRRDILGAAIACCEQAAMAKSRSPPSLARISKASIQSLGSRPS